VAEALLRKLKPGIEVDSAGSNPVVPDAVAGSARNYLSREGANHFLKRFPEGIASKQLDKYQLIICMEPHHKEAILKRCPECEHKIVVWNIEDPYFLPYGFTEKIFNQIKEKVAELANSL
jgi:protein-tyrosine-phosphatase